ncbi:hypothetical protein NEA10_11020 [Phormidium yuhuli AB48]|uniref:Fluorescence recovery protein n=1 Tax=Phormidium yuhuli AB48 TaxID=2940671 RepID=A0ABY5AME6_9CYAN|nr:hypothetical protein [Phormidium yuhuli]USR89424.1 hypothetical protein NEA10_11020 [Phormidium yuhuli AB48]
MPQTDIDWTTTEKDLAQAAFEKAYHREVTALVEEVQQTVQEISNLDELWRLHDYLSARRHDIDGKYDYRDSMFLFAFSQLIKEGWLSLEELEGLHPSKRQKVAALARM